MIENKKIKMVEIKQEKEEKKMSMQRELVYECNMDGCGFMCITESGLRAHQQKGNCEADAKQREVARADQDVTVLMDGRNIELVQARNEAIDSLAVVDVVLTPLLAAPLSLSGDCR